MSKPPVEVVLINWKRPENVAKILDALQGQSVPCTITVCDCHPSEEFALSPKAHTQIDRLYRWTNNLGSFNRYVPCAAYDHEYTYLPDDDMLPGSRCLEHFLDHAPKRPFGVLGQIGRRLEPDHIYRTQNVKRTRALEEVDLIIRAYFVRTRNLGHVVGMKWETDQQIAEDDILLSVAMQLKANLGSYLTPFSLNDETSVVKQKLPEHYAISKRSDHRERRTEVFRQAMQLGWSPYYRRAKPAVVRTLRAIFG